MSDPYSQLSIDDVLHEPGLIRHPVVSAMAEKNVLPGRLLGRLMYRYEGGPWFSWTLRYILAKRHKVFVGAYSYGCWVSPGATGPGLSIGRYVSIANPVAWPSDHPTDKLSTHNIFYEPMFGYSNHNPMASRSLRVEHDAWIGTHAIITAKCKRIGIGAVVAAGAVVTRDVPDFAIVAGMPAKIMRYRFPEDVREKVLASRWWEQEPAALKAAGNLPMPLA